MRPVRPRTNSVRSGFIFCGIALEPVEKRSGSVMNPNSAVAKSVISSAKRLVISQPGAASGRISRTRGFQHHRRVVSGSARSPGQAQGMREQERGVLR